MTRASEIFSHFESKAPLNLQESYDNSGLQIGDKNTIVDGVLLCVDITEEILNEALQHKCNVIISHHPLIFGGLKRISGNSATERIVSMAIKQDLVIYSCHSNADAIITGVNSRLAQFLDIQNSEVLVPLKQQFAKLAFYVPVAEVQKVREAIFEAGAGTIANYDSCSFNSTGYGTFRAGEGASPFVGEINQLHQEEEVKVETILPKNKISDVVKALLKSHPYEEVAYDIYPLLNESKNTGFGIIGNLKTAISFQDFASTIKKHLRIKNLRYAGQPDKIIKRVALMGGSGASYIRTAINQQADVFITGDIKYHEFQLAENRINIVDAGHFETEQFIMKIFADWINEKFSNFAVRLSEINTNPIKYL